MAGFACQHDSIENYPGDTPLGASGRVFPEINWGWQGGLLSERSEEKSVWTAALFSSPRVVRHCRCHPPLPLDPGFFGLPMWTPR